MAEHTLFGAVDPLRPGLDAPTPIQDVARLAASGRRERVLRLRHQAEQIFSDALATHLGRHRVAAVCVLFSGGSDSTSLAHLFRHRATHAIHCNTTIGIEATREFVRATCLEWDLPLLEEIAPKPFRQLVVERGFPGPPMHPKMYSRLKERGLRQARRKLVADTRRERVVFLAGRRRQESRRRARVPLHERDGSVIWISPIANWTVLDLNTYRQLAGDVPVNPVSQLLHMSGECLCGSFAKPGELEQIRAWYPDTDAEIDSIAAEVTAAGHRPPHNRWGHGSGRRSRAAGPLCSDCQLRLFDLDEEAS
ncbi:phosphoadenosine phosphosulfate reductase family protein [Nocardia iowensis]|uniref:Phosphoadenosine phosphosulfate reductase family protein n=1 Tax=Nocardia iowensis TaxID=204891 RepID=A0ABX8RSM3_NOCIO|nr:phosphoadenosine phosphosulfate reductase family protein [Nocardia iowensis]QXN91879.1 phosphoadenosine phosphosulfate reductase family protein [Nocardia iowensis]